MALPHSRQTAVPVEQLKRRHQFLKLEHRVANVGFQHVAKRFDSAGLRRGGGGGGGRGTLLVRKGEGLGIATV